MRIGEWKLGISIVIGSHLLSGPAFASDPKIVAFSCDSPLGASPSFQVRGRTTGFGAIDPTHPILSTGVVSVQSGQLGEPEHINEHFEMNGTISPPSTQWNSSTQKWDYSPMYAYLHGSGFGGRKYTAVFSFGLGSESYLSFGGTQVPLSCDFLAQPSPTESDAGIGACPSSKHWGHGCHCVYENGRSRVVCSE